MPASDGSLVAHDLSRAAFRPSCSQGKSMPMARWHADAAAAPRIPATASWTRATAPSPPDSARRRRRHFSSQLLSLLLSCIAIIAVTVLAPAGIRLVHLPQARAPPAPDLTLGSMISRIAAAVRVSAALARLSRAGAGHCGPREHSSGDQLFSLVRARRARACIACSFASMLLMSLHALGSGFRRHSWHGTGRAGQSACQERA